MINLLMFKKYLVNLKYVSLVTTYIGVIVNQWHQDIKFFTNLKQIHNGKYKFCFNFFISM